MKFRSLTAIVASTGLLTACAGASADTDPDAALGVLAASTPHAEILEWVDENDDSFELDISTVAGGPESKAAVANGSVPVNFFQHEPYLLDWQDQTGQDGVEVLGQVHIEPISLYSTQHTDIADLPDGARIALPRSASNFARGLLLLQDHGLITLDAELDPGAVSQITVDSIADNPHGFEFLPIEDELTTLTRTSSSGRRGSSMIRASSRLSTPSPPPTPPSGSGSASGRPSSPCMVNKNPPTPAACPTLSRQSSLFHF